MIYNTYDFDEIKILVIWPKSGSGKWAKKGFSQGPIDGAFFSGNLHTILEVWTKFQLVDIFFPQIMLFSPTIMLVL